MGVKRRLPGGLADVHTHCPPQRGTFLSGHPLLDPPQQVQHLVHGIGRHGEEVFQVGERHNQDMTRAARPRIRDHRSCLTSKNDLASRQARTERTLRLIRALQHGGVPYSPGIAEAFPCARVRHRQSAARLTPNMLDR